MNTVNPRRGYLLGPRPLLGLLRHGASGRLTGLGLAQLGLDFRARQGERQLTLGQLISLLHQHLVDAPRHLGGDRILLRLNLALQAHRLRLIGQPEAPAQPNDQQHQGKWQQPRLALAHLLLDGGMTHEFTSVA